jgi:hypothetical protein
MRNLEKYPILFSEMVETLRRLSDELAKEECVGDMRPLILKTAADWLEYDRWNMIGKRND